MQFLSAALLLSKTKWDHIAPHVNHCGCKIWIQYESSLVLWEEGVITPAHTIVLRAIV